MRQGSYTWFQYDAYCILWRTTLNSKPRKDSHILAITFEILHVYVVKGRERFMIGLLSHKIGQIKRIHMRYLKLYSSNLSFSLVIFMTKNYIQFAE